MQTISILAIPKYKDSGMKTEVLYQVRSNMSVDNPLNCFCKDMESSRYYTPGKGLKLPKWFPEFAIKKAKKISKALYGAWGRHYFEKRPVVHDHVILRDPQLIECYCSLASQYELCDDLLDASQLQLSDDREQFMKGCCQLSLEQKLIDLEYYKQEVENVHNFYERLLRRDLPESLEPIDNYLRSSLSHKQAEILLLKHQQGNLDYSALKALANKWPAGKCDWFRIMGDAKCTKHILDIGPKYQLETNIYRFGERAAMQQDDMSAERLIFLMKQAQYFMLPGFDMYLQCA